MVGQVKVVAILMIVQGSLALVAGFGLMAAGGLAAISVTAAPSNQPKGDAVAGMIAVAFYVIYGLVVLIVGALNLFGGIKGLQFRGRVLALVALFGNIIPIFTCYCAPTSLGVMIYGLIVMFQADVAEAFRLGEEGTRPDAILARFARGGPTGY